MAEAQLCGRSREVYSGRVQLIYTHGAGIWRKSGVRSAVNGRGRSHPGGLRAAGGSGPTRRQGWGGNGVEILGEKSREDAERKRKRNGAEVQGTVLQLESG